MVVVSVCGGKYVLSVVVLVLAGVVVLAGVLVLAGVWWCWF